MLYDLIVNSRAFVAAARFWAQLTAAALWIWIKILRPAGRPLWAALGWLWTRWRAAWDAWVYDDQGRFAWNRGGIFLSGTLVVLYLTPAFLALLFDAGLYAATVSDDRVYLTQSEEIYPDDDVHSIKGCAARPCTDQNTVYYRVGPSAFNHLWSLGHNADLFYPDEVAAAVPPGMNDCLVRRYGVRAKFLMRRMDIYPKALRIMCEPVQDAAAKD